jgi:hypothetical protein
MSELRPFALLRTGDQWIRCSFEDTFLDLDTGVVELARTTTTADSDQPAPTTGGGLAFDNECRLYHSLPSANRIERTLWKAADPLGPVGDQPPPLDVFEGETDETFGDFAAADRHTPLHEPRGLAVDVNDRLFIAESSADRSSSTTVEQAAHSPRRAAGRAPNRSGCTRPSGLCRSRRHAEPRPIDGEVRA